MKLEVEYDKTRGQIQRREIDLEDATFRLERRRLTRICIGSIPFLLMAGIALYYEQTPMVWMALLFGAMVTGLQLLYYGVFEQGSNPKELEVNNFYSKGALIAFALFWSALIVAVSLALYLKAQAI